MPAAEFALDIVDREVAFAHGDGQFADRIAGGRSVTARGRAEEGGALFRVVAELMAEDAEAAGGIAEAPGGFGEGSCSTKKARRASYWRWSGSSGERKKAAAWDSVIPFSELEAIFIHCYENTIESICFER